MIMEKLIKYVKKLKKLLTYSRRSSDQENSASPPCAVHCEQLFLQPKGKKGYCMIEKTWIPLFLLILQPRITLVLGQTFIFDRHRDQLILLLYLLSPLSPCKLQNVWQTRFCMVLTSYFTLLIHDQVYRMQKTRCWLIEERKL